MENLENKDVQEPAAQAPAQEPAAQEPKGNPEVEISTKEALAALRKNAKVKAKEVWDKTKPKLKVIATVGAIGLTGAYVYSELTKPELSSSDVKMLEPTPIDIPPTDYQMEPALQTPMQEPALQGPAQVTENVVNPE